MANLDDPTRLSSFRGPVIDNERDPVLEEVVAEAARVAGAPMAAITFVMGHVQYFRAGVGLPPELDLSRATARCHSYCQFVVLAEKPFVVPNIAERSDLPQALVQTYGLNAYLGVPVYCQGQILGTLCVADAQAREFSGALIARLEELATRVSKRLDELAAQGRLGIDGVVSSQAEIGDLADSVALGSQVLERALAEVGPMVRLAGGLGNGTLDADAFVRGTTALKEAIELYSELLSAARDVSATSDRLKRSLELQEAAE